MGSRFHHLREDESGFTLVEAVVTMVLVVIGMFPVLSMLDTGNETTADTMGREGATNLARELVERAQGMTYASLDSGSVATNLRTAADSAGLRGSVSGPSSWTIKDRASGTYTVTASSCLVAAPSARVRVLTSTDTICSGSAGSGGPTSPVTNASSGSCSAAAVNDATIGVYIKLLVVDTSLCASSSLLATVCTLVGNTTPLSNIIGSDGSLNLLLDSTLGAAAGVNLCGGKPVSASPSSTDPLDAARRVSVTVAWTRNGSTRSVTQSTVVNRP